MITVTAPTIARRDGPRKCIFFLTFEYYSIYESRCDFFESQIRMGESIDEERNQESRSKEESRREEKEVARQRPSERDQRQTGPGNGAFFFFARRLFTNFCTALFTVSAT